MEVCKLADLVLWDQRFLGVRPAVVMKGGALAWAALGDPNASIPTPQPVMMRPSFGDAIGADISYAYVSPAAIDAGLADELGLRRRLRAVEPTRAIGKADLKNNSALPAIVIRPDTFEISIDGEVVVPSPAEELPLAQLYNLF